MTHRHILCNSSANEAAEAAACSVTRVNRWLSSWRLVYIILFSLAGGMLIQQRQVQAQSAEVNQVKAAYLYNFAKFVEWPAEAYRAADDPAIICAVGDERTGEILQQAVSGKKANGRRVEARYPRTPRDMRSCHVLFIGFSEKGRITDVLHDLENSHVLTVGQTEQFIPLGGMINLAQNNGRIELEIDPEAAEAAGLKISSRLLVVAHLAGNANRAGGVR